MALRASTSSYGLATNRRSAGRPGVHRPVLCTVVAVLRPTAVCPVLVKSTTLHQLSCHWQFILGHGASCAFDGPHKHPGQLSAADLACTMMLPAYPHYRVPVTLRHNSVRTTHSAIFCRSCPAPQPCCCWSPCGPAGSSHCCSCQDSQPCDYRCRHIPHTKAARLHHARCVCCASHLPL
jgi:hypothetical protein